MAASPLKIFLKLDAIDGDSTVKGHEKEIMVLSYEQGVAVAIAAGGGGGAAVGRPQFSDVHLRKDMDKASVPMMMAAAMGQHIRQALFTFRRATFEFYKVTLEDVLITKVFQRAGTDQQYPLSFTALDAGAANSGFLDDVTLTYTRIHWEHRAQRPDGSVVATNGGWDVRTNQRI